MIEELIMNIYNFLDSYSRVNACTPQKMKISIKHFFSKCDQIRRNLRIWPHLLKKSFMENLIYQKRIDDTVNHLQCNILQKQLTAKLLNIFVKEIYRERFHLSHKLFSQKCSMINVWYDPEIPPTEILFVLIAVVSLVVVLLTAKNTVISPNFLVWKFCGKAHFPYQEIR